MSSPWLRPVLIVLAVGLSAWLVVMLVTGGDDEFRPATGEPVLASVSDLESFVDSTDRTVYWVGEVENVVYELTETASGRVYVRYLTEGSEAGDPSPGIVTVGTYPVKDAAGVLRDAANAKEGKELAMSKNGAVVLLETDRAENVHMAFPNADEQVEIYSPDPKLALRYASGDKVTPIP